MQYKYRCCEHFARMQTYVIVLQLHTLHGRIVHLQHRQSQYQGVTVYFGCHLDVVAVFCGTLLLKGAGTDSAHRPLALIRYREHPLYLSPFGGPSRQVLAVSQPPRRRSSHRSIVFHAKCLQSHTIALRPELRVQLQHL